jgi:ABC-type transport system involved in cytochrome bd biosynthesis fused ATPase/permease subunit
MMFEGLMARVARLASERAAARRRDLAERLAGALPSDVRAEADQAGVRLSGGHLRRRLALDSRLNWLIAGLIK